MSDIVFWGAFGIIWIILCIFSYIYWRVWIYEKWICVSLSIFGPVGLFVYYASSGIVNVLEKIFKK